MTPRLSFTLCCKVRTWASLTAPDDLSEAVPADLWRWCRGLSVATAASRTTRFLTDPYGYDLTAAGGSPDEVLLLRRGLGSWTTTLLHRASLSLSSLLSRVRVAVLAQRPPGPVAENPQDVRPILRVVPTALGLGNRVDVFAVFVVDPADVRVHVYPKAHGSSAPAVLGCGP